MILSAPAKINLTLEVVGVEPNGYHLLDTLFAWLDLEDTVELRRATRTSLSVVADGVDTAAVGESDDNLVMRALRSLEETAGQPLPTAIVLTKRIPAGGGLGGGSADAAATLFGLNLLHGLGLSQHRLLEIARPLGADVAFGLVGGMARGTRYGDVLEALEPPPELKDRSVILILPDFPCPTPQVYRLWDQKPTYLARGASDRFLAARGAEAKLAAVANDLEEAACRLHPRLVHLKALMRRVGLQGACLSGSGSTLFGFLPPGGSEDEVKRAFAGEGVRVAVTKLKESTRFGLVS